VSDRLTWLGHATVLIELGPLQVLTDPLLRDRVAHLRRHVPAPAPPARLDAVLVSHLHRDHADGPSLRRLPDAPVLAPAGAGAVMRKLCRREVVELRSGETVRVGDGTVTAVPAVHDGRRSPLHPPVPALGFVVERALRVYFAGDTDIFDEMAGIGPLDVALVPIWGWGSSLGPGHLDPEGAARAVALLAPRVVVPIHWATYMPLGYSGDHPLLREPGPAFAAHVAELAPGTEVALLRPGDSLAL
jgi:L-ascorbate metabolism protein UlaG (beta-lactamase superfamily)